MSDDIPFFVVVLRLYYSDVSMLSCRSSSLSNKPVKIANNIEIFSDLSNTNSGCENNLISDIVNHKKVENLAFDNLMDFTPPSIIHSSSYFFTIYV